MKMRMLIADDEVLICRLLQGIIHWEELGIECVGFASDGDGLLSMIKQMRPELVLTDICMPGKDGLEVIHQCQLARIPCKFIVISGYRQFEYARTALRYGVKDYLLKPINAEEINALLARICEELRGEQPQPLPKDERRLESLFMEYFLTSRAPLGADSIRERYGIRFSPGLFRVAILRIVQNGCATLQNGDFFALQGRALEMGRQKLAGLTDACLLHTRVNEVFMLLNYPPAQEGAVRAAMNEVFASVGLVLGDDPALHLHMGVGCAVECCEELLRSRKSAEAAILGCLSAGRSTILWGKREADSQHLPQEEYQATLRAVRMAFEECNVDKALAAIHALFAQGRIYSIVGDVHRLLLEAADIFFSVFEKQLEGGESPESLKKELALNLQSASSIQQLEDTFCRGIRAQFANVMEKIGQQQSHYIRNAMDYIRKNYARKISLEDIAAFLNLSPTYFSNLFKKETGDNFSNYLTTVRMEEAKRLLRQSNMNIAEIADHVGYGDARYFSRMFVKTVGLKPSQYKRIYG